MKDGALMDITGSSMTWTSIGRRGLCDGSGNMGRKDVLSDTYDWGHVGGKMGCERDKRDGTHDECGRKGI